MFFILWSKPNFRENSRYILFAHMLFNDSVTLISILVLYLLALAYIHLARAVCAILILITVISTNNSSLNLAVISLERYVAICFPLHHAEIATKRRTKIAIGVTWLISSINFTIDMFYMIVTDPLSFTTPIICTRQQIFIDKWQIALEQWLSIFFLVVVAVTIIYTYIGITLAAKSARTNKDSAKRARNTVLLHLIQLGLCLTSFVHASVEALISGTDASVYVHLQLFIFLTFVILPRCLSPLIYGLRDNAIRPLFLRYFQCNHSTVKPVLITH
ncbi:odorant receptor 131-2-like [Anguilla rostrata]